LRRVHMETRWLVARQWVASRPVPVSSQRA
jgi:hypothetical protein